MPPGQAEKNATKPLVTQRDLALAYSPGVAAPCVEIHKNPDTAYDYTVRGGAIEGGLMDKRGHAERMAHDQKVPVIRLVEGVGASVRGLKTLGATYVPTVPGWEYSVANLSRVPVVSAAFGSLAGLPAIAKKLDIPVYCSRLTAPEIPWGEFSPKLELFQAGASFVVGDIDIDSFTIPHDAADPVGFSFRTQGLKVSIATDLGYLPESVRQQIQGSDVLLLESNHDLEMLKVGPYPWSVKQRVMGRMGHLSNEVACGFIRETLDSRTSTLILGHLSAHNNHPAIVEQCARMALDERGLAARLVVAEPNQPTESFVY